MLLYITLFYRLLLTVQSEQKFQFLFLVVYFCLPTEFRIFQNSNMLKFFSFEYPQQTMHREVKYSMVGVVFQDKKGRECGVNFLTSKCSHFMWAQTTVQLAYFGLTQFSELQWIFYGQKLILYYRLKICCSSEMSYLVVTTNADLSFDYQKSSENCG